jgi:tetratricopeptide (TPR) repeat protein
MSCGLRVEQQVLEEELKMSSAASTETSAGSRLATLLALLESDAENVALLSDAAEVAIAERKPEIARALLERHEAIQPLSPSQINLLGLAAMQAKDFEDAAKKFRSLAEAGVDDPAVRFNLAWSLAMLKDFPGAAELLGEEVTAGLPEAAMLRVQLLHQQELLDEAASEARTLIGLHPDHEGLLAAVSVLALDIDDEALALTCASKAGDHPDAMSTLGMLALGDDRATEARDMFDRVLATSEAKPRAWVGRGLSKLLTGEAAAAPQDIDRGAEMFGDHLGSWIAAGWAHVINHDFSTARARFETALEIDPTFAETHGSLAVMDLLENDVSNAQARCETALRLDPACYSGALAKSLLAARSGNEDTARRIFELALNTPIGEGNRTIAQSLTRLGL